MVQVPTTLDWLRSRDDRELVRLLRARPDLTVPAPTDLTVLAGRLNTGPSVWRAMESLTLFHIQILQALAVLGAEKHAVARDDIADLLGPDVPDLALASALGDLELLALVRGTDVVHMPSAVSAALSPYPAGLGSPGQLTVDEARAALAGVDDDQRSVLDRLAHGTPRGSADHRSRVAAALSELVESGLLRRVDAGTVELPREVGIALRGDRPLGEIQVRQPVGEERDHGIRTVDGTGGGQSLATVARLGRLLEVIGQNPPPALKSGGLGVRELRRLAKAMGEDEASTALDIELLAAAAIIATSDARGRSADAWTPTKAADDFLALPHEQAWALIAQTWLDLRRNPSRVGTRDAADKVLNALSVELSWIRGPAERRFVLGALADLPLGFGLDRSSLSARLAWRSPLRPPERRDAVLTSTVTEATALGLVAFDALTTAGRAVLRGNIDEAAAALEAALPAPVDTVLIQADLTIVAPGRLEPGLAARLGQVADVESAGSATVYRVTPQTIRRALDAGASTADLHELFTRHSATGVPQALSYLIDDIGRRYGVLRAGRAGTYVRSDDPALIDQAVAEAAQGAITLRRLAPTVAITAASLDDLINHLRSAGMVPAAEDASGAVLDLRPRPQRIKASPPIHQLWREPAPPSDDQLDNLVARMRSADRAGAVSGTGRGQGAASPPGASLTLLRDAADHRGSVWIGYVDAEGGTSHRIIEPVAISGGAVVAYDRLRGAMRTFALHRISRVRPVDDDGIEEPVIAVDD